MPVDPYPHVSKANEAPSSAQDPQGQGWNCEYHFADTPNVSGQQECLSIRTRVPGPLQPGQTELRLVALQRVHKLLGDKIEAMKSP
jgi:hypothetical protein